jgi:cation diffusion facilitator CzcD-associated flavoprotein CzcO
MDSAKPKICVIGAGIYGLAATKYLKDVGEVTTFEAKDTVGGVWAYSDVTEDNHPDLENDPFYKLYGNLHQSLYKNLTLNVPKPCMTLKDFPHKPETPTMMSADEFHDYLNRYSDHFELRSMIKLNTLVTKVRLSTNEGDRKFTVTWEGLESGIDAFDYVIQCIGLYSNPYTPGYPGANDWDGTQIHTHNY